MNNFDDLLNNNPAEERPQLSKEDYAAKMQAEREDLFTLSDEAALGVAGSGEYFREYLNVQATFSRYSAVNALLIYAQQELLPGEKATRVAAFDFWKERGGYIKKGETGISILEPHEYTKEDGTPGTGYNVKKVFDVSQVDTRKMKAAAPVPTYTERQLLQALISKAPMKIVGVDEIPDGYGAMTDPESGEISVRRGMEFADTFRSIAQELGYYEADADAKNIPINPSFVGYCTAYILCKKHGVDTKSFDFAAASDVFRNSSPQGIKQELSQIRDAADNISGRMAKHLDAVSKAARNQEAR